MVSRERVKRAITFCQPDRVPMVYFNFSRRESDIVMIDIQQHFGGRDKLLSEWGFAWDRVDGTMGQVRQPILENSDDIERLQAPPLKEAERSAQAEAEIRQCDGGQYLVASLQLSGFTTMTLLRGFVQCLEDLMTEPELCGRLADVVFDFEEELIRIAAKCGFDGVAFFDDWGTQQGTIISPQLWRTFFAPRYARLFQAVHTRGMDVYFHSCGKIDPIIPFLFEAGVDMLNLSQPNLYDMEVLGCTYGGKNCFVIPVSYQTTSLSGSREDIFADVKKAISCLGAQGGGLIGYVEQYDSLRMPQENFKSCIEAFTELGKYKE